MEEGFKYKPKFLQEIDVKEILTDKCITEMAKLSSYRYYCCQPI